MIPDHALVVRLEASACSWSAEAPVSACAAVMRRCAPAAASEADGALAPAGPVKGEGDVRTLHV